VSDPRNATGTAVMHGPDDKVTSTTDVQVRAFFNYLAARFRHKNDGG